MNPGKVLSLIKSMGSVYQSMCEGICLEYGIQQPALDILLFLDNNPQYNTARDICHVRCIRPNVVSFHVERLVADGYLERSPVEGDRRKIQLSCTEKARQVTQKGRVVQQEFYEALHAGLCEEDRQVMRHCFQVIERNVHQLQERPPHPRDGQDG